MSGFSVPPTKWVFRKKPNEMYSTKRTVNIGIEKDHRKFNPRAKLGWAKSSFHPFTFFLLIAILGFTLAFFYFNRKDEMVLRSVKQNKELLNLTDKENDYLLNNAEYEFVNGNFVAAKKDLDLVLKSNPQSVKANRLYIQTMIQLVGKYPSYREEAIRKTEGCLKYLTDSENDKKLLLAYNQIVLYEY